MGQGSRLTELSASIAYNTAVLEGYLTSNNVPPPSFDADGPPMLMYPPHIEAARAAVEEATLELNELARGPARLLMGGSELQAAKAVISKFDIASIVPPVGTISYEDLASKTGINQGALEAILRLAICHRIFTEPIPGRVAHSAASKHLLSPFMAIASQVFADDFLMNSAYIPQALVEHPQANEPTRAAAAVANGCSGQRSFYEVLQDYPERAKNFHGLMAIFQRLPGLEWDYLASGFDWTSLPDGSLCVDVGGGHGEAAVAVASKFAHLKWMVQDTESGFEGRPVRPDGLAVDYMEHDFFTPQPAATKGAAVFFMRWILHNWPDAYCHGILQALIPSLRKDARILIMEQLMPEPGSISIVQERGMRSLDVGQLALGNGRERNLEQWKRLFAETDEQGRFQLRGVSEPEGSQLAIFEVVWEGEDADGEGLDGEDARVGDVNAEGVHDEGFEGDDITSEDANGEDIKGEDVKGRGTKGEDIKGEDIKDEDIEGEDFKGEDVRREDPIEGAPKGEVAECEGRELEGVEVEEPEGKGMKGGDLIRRAYHRWLLTRPVPCM
ncbi:uncharacterized protein LTR77_005306 [Saxophila tyrrhenica]|uniref:O-methyltransferase C-terminal domain-containing protein n=1 Tax=Saxophila tyrrhenica TaxID=1690608 RepID=A0AAV9P8B7_9PEZI|nr:hypothetical protein LTR77_005306 [Saxophila tyrrhenica]